MARVVVDPVDLRRGATRLREASKELNVVARALGAVGLPEMPGGVAAQVQGGLASARSLLDGNAPQLADGAVELARRALWAEIADRLDAGYPLTGTQLKEFVAWMKDGTLLRFATPHEAANAGTYLGVLYRGNFKQPDKLIELAQILHAGETWADPEQLREFSGAFVESFGAQNLVEVPRVIQAIEWSHVINGSFGPQEAHVLDDVAREWGDRSLEQDPVNDLLAPFAIALANATYSGRLTRTTEDAIAHDEDTWATAQLLAKGMFNTHFLLECFKTGVVQKIVDHTRWESVAAGLGEEPHDAPYSLGRFWEHGDHEGVPYDTKQIVLQALARNPEAAAAALTGPLAVEVWERTAQQVPVHDAVQLIYRYGDFDDGGAGFGSAFASAEAHLHGADREAAGKLTLNVIDQVTNHGRDSLGGVTDSLGHVVGDHYARDLHLSAFNQGLPIDFDGDRDGIRGEATGDGISLSKEQTTRLVTSLIAREGAREPFMDGVAAYQANLVHAGAGAPSDDWLRQIGKFDGLLNTANERNDLHDYSDALAREHAIASGLDKVTSLLPLPKGIDVLASDVPDLVAGHFGPHGPGPADTSLEFHDRLIARMDSTIVASYVDAHPQVAAEIPHDLDRLRGEHLGFHVKPFVGGSGHVLPWGAMDEDQRQTFVRWVSSTASIEQLTQGPLRTAHDAFYGNDQDQSVPPTVP